MSQQPSGWYDDPNDPDQLRYWDGVIWTDRVAPKRLPTLDQSTIGSPPPQPPRNPYAGHAPGQGRPQWGAPHGQQPPRPPWAGAGQGYYSIGQATTPDGQLLSGWWRRVGARIIDGILTTIISAIVAYPLVRDISSLYSTWMQKVFNNAQAGRSTAITLPAELFAKVALFGVVTFVVYGIWEVVLLAVFGSSPGRRITGISVRLRDRPGPLPWGTSLARYVIKEGGELFGLIPAIGFIGNLFIVLDSLFPLWDQNKQAIHEKVARTNVVVGRQKRP